ncbi:MAG: fructosamine kinase family protein, partial [Candidatus Binatia bacterium]
TPQVNTWADSWIDFWREQRLGFQLALAAQNGYGGALQRKGAQLMEVFPALFEDQLAPSLLHGDLWGGNRATDHNGNPVIFDPAVYYGDREADLAMTELFGGFEPAFYRAYAAVHPLAPNYPLRKAFYNLYHILNHLNLFGGGYGNRAEHMMEMLLNALRH